MSPCRLLCAAVGAGMLLTALPAFAALESGSEERRTAAADPAAPGTAEGRALALLERAAQAGRRLTWTGTQYTASWRRDAADSALVELHHDPATGPVLTGGDDGQQSAAGLTPLLDPRMLSRLAGAFALSIVGPGRCTGRDAWIVEAQRPNGQVAGRFWIDHASGLLLRREVFDDAGRRARSSAFIDLAVTESGTTSGRPAMTARTGGERPAGAAVERLRHAGWHVPDSLPGGFRLLETRLSGVVLHLAYTDGLSTLSLFAQAGGLGSAPPAGFSAEQVDGAPVWVHAATPERVVWSGGDRVWTLVSDAPDDAVRAAVAALPRDQAPDGGVRARLGRGLARLAGMLNPFG